MAWSSLTEPLLKKKKENAYLPSPRCTHHFPLPSGWNADVEVRAMLELGQPSQDTKQKPSVKESSHNHATAPAVLGCLGLNWYMRQKI